MTVTAITLGASSPVAERALFGWPRWAVFETGSSGAKAEPTKAAPAANFQHVLYKIIVSWSAASGAIEIDVKDGSTVILPIQVPAGTVSPLQIDFGLRGLAITPGAAFTVTVPLTTSVVTSCWVMGDTIQAP